MLFNQLRKLSREVQWHFPAINHGGCCVFAAEVAKALARKDIDVYGVVCMNRPRDGINIDTVRTKIADTSDPWEWYNNGVMFNHVALGIIHEFDDYHFDSEYLKHADSRLGDLHVIPGSLTVKELVWFAANDSMWNTAFDRSDIPKIKKMIRKFLK